MTDTPSEGVLSGVRVLEVGGGVPAAFASHFLAGYGADVVRTESPAGTLTHDETVYLCAGKRRIDLPDAELRALALGADILIEDGKPGALAARGLDPVALRREKPSLVIVSITPFGQTGPYAEFEATNLTSFAMGGLMSLTGSPNREPLLTGGNQAQALGGMNAFGAAVTAHYGALIQGEGDWVDISLQECAAGMLELYGPGSAYTGAGPQMRMGNSVRSVWAIYPCLDGYAGVCALERQVHSLFDLLGDPVLNEDRFRDPYQRAENDDELQAMLYAWFAQRTKAEILALSPVHKVPFGAVLTPNDLLASENLAQRRFFDSVQTPEGEARVPGRPFEGFVWTMDSLHDAGADTEEVRSEWLAGAPA